MRLTTIVVGVPLRLVETVVTPTVTVGAVPVLVAPPPGRRVSTREVTVLMMPVGVTCG